VYFVVGCVVSRLFLHFRLCSDSAFAVCVLWWLCEVSRYDVVAGDPQCVVSYRGRLYRMRSEPAVATFCEYPDRYAPLVLPFKHTPPVPKHHALKEGQDRGRALLAQGLHQAYLEQNVSELLIQALASLAAGNSAGTTTTTAALPARPAALKYPGLSVTDTVALYVALYLKAHNPRTAQYRLEHYRDRLAAFRRACVLVPDLAAHYKYASSVLSLSRRFGGTDRWCGLCGVCAERTRCRPSFKARPHPLLTRRRHRQIPSASTSHSARSMTAWPLPHPLLPQHDARPPPPRPRLLLRRSNPRSHNTSPRIFCNSCFRLRRTRFASLNS
jgi:hypothetical protein